MIGKTILNGLTMVFGLVGLIILIVAPVLSIRDGIRLGEPALLVMGVVFGLVALAFIGGGALTLIGI